MRILGPLEKIYFYFLMAPYYYLHRKMQVIGLVMNPSIVC
jgi:hypothetical protein